MATMYDVGIISIKLDQVYHKIVACQQELLLHRENITRDNFTFLDFQNTYNDVKFLIDNLPGSDNSTNVP